MMSIGQFAYSTGLSVKTLRYYDEIGLLPAAEVDPFNGYRTYRGSQLREATLLRVLRASGMGVDEMRKALTHPHETDGLIARRRAELAVQRELEDWALGEVQRWQSTDASVVQTRDRAAQRWAGVAVSLDLRAVSDDVEGEASAAECMGRLEELSAQLHAELSSRGVAGPLEGEGRAWIELRSDPARASVIEVVSCIAVHAPVQPDLTLDGHQVLTGELPDRVEAFVTTEVPAPGGSGDPDGPEARLAGGPLPKPAAIALAVVAEESGADPSCVRQHTRVSDEGFVLEWCVTLP